MTNKKSIVFRTVFISILTIILCIGIISVSDISVKAAETITRGEWIHTLVTEMELTIDDGIYPDDYYPDITESEYYDDILVAINYGIINLEAGEDFGPDEIATREFAADTLGFCTGYVAEEEINIDDADTIENIENAKLAVSRGWFNLSEGKFNPDQAITTAEKDIMVTDIQAMMDEDNEEPSSSTLVFADGIIEIPSGIDVSVTENEDETADVEIVDCPESIAVGTKFAVYDEGFPYVLEAKTVEITDNTYMIHCSYVEDGIVGGSAGGTIDVDYSDIEPADGVEMTILDDEQPVTLNAVRGLRSAKAKKGKKLHFETNVSGVRVVAEVNNIRADWDYDVLSTKCKAILKGDIVLLADTKLVDVQGSIPLAQIGVKGIGTVGLSLEASVVGNVEMSWKSNFEVGFKYDNYKGVQYIHKMSKGDLDYKAKVDADFYFNVGVDLGPKWSIWYCPYGVIYARGGIKCTAQLEAYADNKLPDQCLDLQAYVYARAGYDFGLKRYKSWQNEFVIWDWKNSPVRFSYHSEDGVKVAKCSRGMKTTSGKKPKYYTPVYNGTGRRTVSSYIDSGLVLDSSASGDTVTYKPAYDYTLDDEGNATITKYNGYAHYIDIPEYIDGHKVVAIGSRAFEGNTYVQSVGIPDGVTTIGDCAFYKCNNLVSVEIPDNVTEIGSQAFYECVKLVNVDLPQKLVTIYYGAFSKTAITKITIPKSLEEVWDGGPFENCESLKNIYYEEGITQIPQMLFENCTGLEEVEIPDTVTTIGDGAYRECLNLVSVEIPDSVTEIGSQAFYECVKLVNVDLPQKLVTIYQGAFSKTAITEITIPKSLENVWNGGPFEECEQLKSVDFEKGMEVIPYALFEKCTGLEEIEIPNTIKKLGWNSFKDCVNLKSIDMSDGLTEVDSYAFADCVSLKNIIVPDTVKTMGIYIFSGCTALEKVHIPDTQINIPNGTFLECSSLTEVNFPDTLEIIESQAFYNCTSLTEVNLPEKVNAINERAFSGCTSLAKVSILSSVETIYSSAFSHCEALTDLTISDGVTTIYSNAFEYNKALVKVTLPDSLQTLGDYAFRYCDSLSEVHLGAGLKTIPKYCFYEDPELKTIVLPQQVTTVDEFAFGNCTKFTDVTMNRNVTSAAVNAFSYPAKLTIHGVSGTYAETFADDNNIKFVALASPTTDIKLNKTELELGRGYTDVLTVSITPVDSADQFTWTSSDEDIVTIDENGKLKGIKSGEATIIAMSGDIMETCAVKVYEAVSSVDVYPYSYEGTAGDTVQLEASIYPSDATYKDVIWTSDNDEVATVDENGLVTLGKYGTAKITVTSKDMNRMATCVVTVKEIAVTGVTLNEKKITIGVGEEKELTAEIQPENATNKNVTWSSTKPDIVSVNDGKITALQVGTANIIVKTENGAKTASCTVTVEAEHVHNLIKTEKKDATCKEEGNIEYWICEGCNRIFTDDEGKEEIAADDIIIPKKAHTLSDTIKENEVVADCETGGSYDEVVKCVVCGEELSRETKTSPELEHDWGEWTVNIPATETEEGEEVRTCKRDENHKETRVITKLEHIHNLIKTEKKDATCKEEGNIEYWTCADCNKIFTDNEGREEIILEATIIQKKDHIPAATVKENEVAATYDMGGSYEEVVKCSVCGEELSRKTIRTDALVRPDNKDDKVEPPVQEQKDNKNNTTEIPGSVNTDSAVTQGQTSSVAKEEGTIIPAIDEKAEFVVTSEVNETPTVEYKGTTDKTAKSVKIPDSVKVDGVTYEVTSVAKEAFKNNKNIESVVIGDKVESIDRNAFEKCSKLTKITLGKNVKKVGKNAFNGCKNLKTVTIKTTKLTKNSLGKNSFKGINKKATIKCPKKQLKNYKKWIKKAGAPNTVKYK